MWGLDDRHARQSAFHVPMSEGMSPGRSASEWLLRAHVERILSMSAVPADDRDDLAEELYGHLWQRWQEAIAAGTAAEEAASAAIAAFGLPEELGPQLTTAYHSRLYASTIGVLLPAITPPADRPHGLGRSRLLLALSAIFQTIGIGILLWGGGLAPVQSIVAFVALAFGLAVTLIAYRALDRQQAWALAFVKLLALVLVLNAIIMFVAKPITINILGILAIFVWGAAQGPQLQAWVAGSRPVRVGLGLVIVAAVGLPWIGATAAAAIPDPTAAGPGDLSMQMGVDCVRADGLVSSGSVVVNLNWHRTDVLPYGLTGWVTGMRNTDNLGISSVDGLEYSGPGFGFPSTPQEGLVLMSRSYLDTVSGAATSESVTMWSGIPSPFFDVGGSVVGIDPGTIVAGRTYRVTYTFLMQPSVASVDAPVFQVRYDHQHRWGVEAVATCGQTVAGQAVTTPEPPVTQGRFLP